MAAKAALAHDFWIQPSTYRPGVGSLLTVSLRVGEDFPRGEPYARNPEHVALFVIAAPRGTSPVFGRTGMEPAGVLRIGEPGVHVLGYESTRTVVELPAERFETYLREQGLDDVVRRRAENGQSSRPGREAFSRCAKSLVLAGADGSTGYDRVLGFTLELIPERNPNDLQAGDDLPVRLLYLDGPLAGARIVARHAEEESATVTARTDPDGRARLRLARGGVWLVRSVHMVAAPPEVSAEWESFWASLTFEFP